MYICYCFNSFNFNNHFFITYNIQPAPAFHLYFFTILTAKPSGVQQLIRLELIHTNGIPPMRILTIPDHVFYAPQLCNQ